MVIVAETLIILGFVSHRLQMSSQLVFLFRDIPLYITDVRFEISVTNTDKFCFELLIIFILSIFVALLVFVVFVTWQSFKTKSYERIV